MRFWHLTFLVGAVVVGGLPAEGARLYLSALGPGEGATPGNAALSVGVGQTATLHLWADLSASEELWVLALDFVATEPAVTEGVSSFQFAEFEAEVDRWYRETSPGAPGDVLEDVRAIAAAGAIGINGRYLDATYEPGAGFYVGAFDVKGTRVGKTDVFLVVDTVLIVGPVVDNMYFGTGDERLPYQTARGAADTIQHYLDEGTRSALADATITVHSPEPGTMGLLVFGGLALGRRRSAA